MRKSNVVTNERAGSVQAEDKSVRLVQVKSNGKIRDFFDAYRRLDLAVFQAGQSFRNPCRVRRLNTGSPSLTARTLFSVSFPALKAG